MNVSVVIPAYNEEKTISRVLEPLTEAENIGEIIVVSDGSIDNTAIVAESMGAKVIQLSSNKGKGGAMMVGVKASSHPVILFLDADLLGLTPEHINDLIFPVLFEKYCMSVGVFEKGRVATDLAQYFAPFLSGQRVVKRDVFNEISDIDASRFGIEVVLTQYVIDKKLPFKEVHLKDMSHVMKEEKLGFYQGFKARMKMYWDIVKIVSKSFKTGTKD